jgi:hypothetical protein
MIAIASVTVRREDLGVRSRALPNRYDIAQSPSPLLAEPTFRSPH